MWSGDRWALRCGDVLQLLEQERPGTFDGVFADCPYSSGGATRGDRTADTLKKYVNSDSANRAKLSDFEGDTRDQRGFAHWCALWYSLALRATVEGGVLVSFTDWRQLPATTDAIQAGGWVWRGIIPWNKTESARPQLGRPRAQCEYAVFATKGPHRPYEGAPALEGFFVTAPTPRERVHIAQKPVELLARLLELTPPGGHILEPFCGSGTTGVAALRTGRRVTLYEISPAIAEAAAARLQAEAANTTAAAAAAGQVPMFGGEG